MALNGMEFSSMAYGPSQGDNHSKAMAVVISHLCGSFVVQIVFPVIFGNKYLTIGSINV